MPKKYEDPLVPKYKAAMRKSYDNNESIVIDGKTTTFRIDAILWAREVGLVELRFISEDEDLTYEWTEQAHKQQWRTRNETTTCNGWPGNYGHNT